MAQEILDRLVAGDDCEQRVKAFVRSGQNIPAELVLATFGNRMQNVAAAPNSLRVLLEGRANPNAVDQRSGAPMLHAACWHGTPECLRLLLDHRANIEMPEARMGTPPLNTALAAGNAKVVLELLQRHADVQWKHHDGATALHVAVAWIASSYNANLRIPPVGDEPVSVIRLMLRNGVDPTLTEGLTRSNARSIGMTPLESFEREVKKSPWRQDPTMGQDFDRTAKLVHALLEKAMEAMSYKQRGNAAFKEFRFADALKDYSEARRIWKLADVGGHHMAVLWSNEATCYKKLGDADNCKNACEEGVKFYCSNAIRSKLETLSKECDDGIVGVMTKARPAPERVVTKLKEAFLDSTEDPLYPAGSAQGKVENPGPFICNFDEAKEAGFVDGVPGWKERVKLEEQALDEELVRSGLMSPDLLDKPLSS